MRAKGVSAHDSGDATLAPADERHLPSEYRSAPRPSSTIRDEVSRRRCFEEERRRRVVLELHVAEDDAGQVIGRGGRTVARAADRAAGPARRTQETRVLLDVVD